MPDDSTAAPIEAPTESTEPQVANEQELVLDDLIVEDVSIDGMCGVY